MEPWLGVNDKNMFYKYLNQATVYFEYGSEVARIRQV